MRQIVSGKIEAAGREPRNVRVELTDSERGVIISLRDDEGAFLVCQPEETEERGAGHEGGGSGEEEGDGELGGGASHGGGRTRSARPGDGDEHDDATDHAELEAELDRLTEENTAFVDENAALLDENTTLRKEVSELKVKVAEERDKYKSLWRDSCEQLREHDELIAKERC